MKSRKIFGYTNYRYFTSCTYGEVYWYDTRAMRDAARAQSIENARRHNLDYPENNFAAVERTIRTTGQDLWWDALRATGSARALTKGDKRKHRYFSYIDDQINYSDDSDDSM